MIARKPHKVEHVKFVRKGAVWYAYFNTGQKQDGKPVYRALPKWGSVGWWDSYASAKAGRTRREDRAWTVHKLATEYLASGEYVGKADNTRKHYASHLAKVQNILGDFPVEDLHPADIRHVLETEGWAAGTQNGILAVIGVIYRWARRNDRTCANPIADIDRLKGGEHQPWPDDILEAGLKAENDTIRLAVHLLYFTGQRIGDVCKMRWGDIRKGFIHVQQEKTGKVVEPPLFSDLKVELDRTPRKSLLVLGGVKSRQLRSVLQRFTNDLGVHTVPHGLRKNSVNAFLEAGCTVPEVAAITGQTHQIVEHYAAKVNRRKLGEAAVVKLEAHRNKM